jgi:hypothetical protein
MDEKIEVPLPDYIREAAREAARTVISEHVKKCQIGKLTVRVDKLENRFYLVIGAILGSGVLGGSTGALIMNTFGK